MPRVLLSAALFLTAVLSACGGAPSTSATLDLAGQTSLAVGAPASLTATLRGPSGNALPTTATYTSSQPDVIAVDAQGQLTVKRLTATDRPVVLTASADGRQAALAVSTYGLELAVGTYVWNLQPAGATPGRFVAVRYRPESGEAQASTYTVTAPGNETLTCALSQNAVERACWWALPDASKYPAGEYRASLPQNGVSYETTASLPAPEAVLDFVKGPTASGNGRDVTFSGEVPANSRWLYAYVGNRRLETSSLAGQRMGSGPVLRGQVAAQSDDPMAVSVYATALPTTLQVGAAVPAGAYEGWITAMSGNLASFEEVLPEQFNVSATFGGTVTLK
ncbi:hypothetical protein GCM10010840_01910 [Deinococcus aerolatus]|uniref:BIG2 domain-containing protein n=1 Tax=Deinococcus aerolatus TaxID=522487 RepID=A0ABQ2FZL9_9DEIO|nr:hypothetical protein [Deinococcus aerolatus]GGL67524.1 hypothetical protein GCM10010840_01910 [Deinococcus aerolatus]